MRLPAVAWSAIATSYKARSEKGEISGQRPSWCAPLLPRAGAGAGAVACCSWRLFIRTKKKKTGAAALKILIGLSMPAVVATFFRQLNELD
jgi:hypothetical protein